MVCMMRYDTIWYREVETLDPPQWPMFRQNSKWYFIWCVKFKTFDLLVAGVQTELTMI